MKTLFFALAAATAAGVCLPGVALAEDGFASPPGYADPPERDHRDYREARDKPPPDDDARSARDFEPRESSLRVSTGPTLRAMSSHADGGFGAALDIGPRAAGVRFAGNWVRTGSDRGLSQYDAQLWIDFGASERLHPILGAGAGVARVESTNGTGGTNAATVGIGVLRGTLEYVLPIREADARAGIDVAGALPAIRGTDAPNVDGWVLVTARVGIGF